MRRCRRGARAAASSAEKWVASCLQAARLRPTWLHDGQLCLRLGLRGALTVPRAQVRNARKLAAGETVDGALGLALPGARRVLIELSEPAEAVGIYGIRRTVSAVEVGVDEPDRLIEALG
jgi:hypothetical protein